MVPAPSILDRPILRTDGSSDAWRGARGDRGAGLVEASSRWRPGPTRQRLQLLRQAGYVHRRPSGLAPLAFKAAPTPEPEGALEQRRAVKKKTTRGHARFSARNHTVSRRRRTPVRPCRAIRTSPEKKTRAARFACPDETQTWRSLPGPCSWLGRDRLGKFRGVW